MNGDFDNLYETTGLKYSDVISLMKSVKINNLFPKSNLSRDRESIFLIF
jgi:hypothetical protein